MFFRQKLEKFSISYRDYCDCLVTVLRLKASRKSFCAFAFRDCITRKKRVFSVLYSSYDSFSNSLHFPCTASLKLLSTQNHFSLKPLHSQACFLHFHLQGMFSKTFFFSFILDYANIKLGFQNWGFFFFKNGLGFMFL